MKHRLKINKSTGEIQWLNPPPFQIPLVGQRRERFSEIVPSSFTLRVAFRILRFLFGEDGKVAAWTRTWVVMWRMTILQGKHKGVTKEHGIRQILIETERELWHDGIERIT